MKKSLVTALPEVKSRVSNPNSNNVMVIGPWYESYCIMLQNAQTGKIKQVVHFELCISCNAETWRIEGDENSWLALLRIIRSMGLHPFYRLRRHIAWLKVTAIMTLKFSYVDFRPMAKFKGDSIARLIS